MIKTFVYKLYQSKKNKGLHAQIDVAASIYNYCITAYRKYYELTGKKLNKYELQKELTVRQDSACK